MQTEIHTWFERDRAHVELRNANTDETIIEWWDEAVGEAVEDGFLDPRDWHGSAVEYAKSLKLMSEVVAPVDVSWIYEYGMTCKLSTPIRCF